MSLINAKQLSAMVGVACETPAGDWLEVGVYRGGSAEKLAAAAKEQARRLWLFDTFTGIPESTEGVDTHQIGDFSDTSVELVRGLVPEAMIVVGDAAETIPATDTGPLAFVHLDCDQYATYRACIVELSSRMVRGGVMWFDDYECLNGARIAVDEIFGDKVKQHDCGKSYVRF